MTRWLQVLALLEKIKRQDAGDEELPPIAMPPLRGAPQEKVTKRPRVAKAEDAAEDGFLNLEEGDISEGFLQDMEETLEKGDINEGFLQDMEEALENYKGEQEQDDKAKSNKQDAKDDVDEDSDEDEEDEDEEEDTTADVINSYIAGAQLHSTSLLVSYVMVHAQLGIFSFGHMASEGQREWLLLCNLIEQSRGNKACGVVTAQYYSCGLIPILHYVFMQAFFKHPVRPKAASLQSKA